MACRISSCCKPRQTFARQMLCTGDSKGSGQNIITKSLGLKGMRGTVGRSTTQAFSLLLHIRLRESGNSQWKEGKSEHCVHTVVHAAGLQSVTEACSMPQNLYKCTTVFLHHRQMWQWPRIFVSEDIAEYCQIIAVCKNCYNFTGYICYNFTGYNFTGLDFLLKVHNRCLTFSLGPQALHGGVSAIPKEK